MTQPRPVPAVEPVGTAEPVLAAWRSATLAAGTTSLILGVILLVWPGETLLICAALLGIGLVLLGIARLATAAVGSAAPGRSRAWRAVSGLIYLAAGILVLANLDASLTFLVRLAGILWLVSGVVEAVSGAGRRAGERAGPVIVGLVSVVVGIVLLVWPKATVLVLVWVSGIWLVVLGLVQLYFGWRAGKISRAAAAT
jgi:uncharacterized membrane protein HdeD (DUF308 family)